MSEAKRAAKMLREYEASLSCLTGDSEAERAIAAALAVLDAQAAEAPPWDDAPLPEDEAIEAAHPMRTGHHDLYAEALRLVGARRSKGSLVDLVCWLLTERRVSTERADAVEALAAQFDKLAEHRQSEHNRTDNTVYRSRMFGEAMAYAECAALVRQQAAAMKANQERKT